MKNINTKLVLLIGLMVLGFTQIANAQKKMWEGKSYNFGVTNNAPNTYLWSTTGLASGLTVTTSTGSATTSFDITFSNSNTTSATGTLRLTETATGSCSRDNDLTVTVFPYPEFSAMSATNFCAASATLPSSVTITSSNFANIKGVTANGNSLTIGYQLYDGTNTPILTAGASGTVSLTTGASASTSTVNLSGTQRTDLLTVLGGLSAGTYTLRVSSVTTNPATVATEAGSVVSGYFVSGNASVLDILSITINSVPSANTITPTN
ncbi:MAG: hypothetical protein CFE21_07320 [Bacteroidetes bacterium B1(2017)]|nr:MAG: hypothetical protein CFE21_07320 [Bacteroidetes bacterium B1(2017)]